MIYGIGIDLIEVERIGKTTLRYGDRLYTKIFTENEINYCKSKSNLNNQSQCFAARFAAKEAFLKAIGTGLRNGLHWKDVEVSNDNLGKPNLVLRNTALEIIKKIKTSNISLSISHTKNAAIAVVILEK